MHPPSVKAALQLGHLVRDDDRLQSVLKHLDLLVDMPAEAVNLPLKLLNPLLLIVGLALLIELVRDQVGQFIVVVVPQRQNLLEIGSLVVVNDITSLVRHNWLSDLRDVLVEDLALDDREELWIVVHYFLPVLLADVESGTLTVCAVDEDLSFVEADVECPDHGVWAQSHLELLDLVDLVADVVLARLDEDDLVDLVELGVDRLMRGELTRLQLSEDVDHQRLVLEVRPSVETVIDSRLVVAILRLQVFGEIEELFELVAEGLKQEVRINLPRDVGRKLDQQIDVARVPQGLVLVVHPHVVEVLLDAHLEVDADRAA